MKNSTGKKMLFPLLLLLVYCCRMNAQNDGWIPSGYPKLGSKVWKTDGKIKYFVDSTMHISQRNEIIRKTKEYIADNLKFINESNFEDSVYLLITRDRNEIKKYIGIGYAGVTIIKNNDIPVNQVYSIYTEEHNPLKHELMHLVSFNKWGEVTDNIKLSWLIEGLAILADPDMDNRENCTFEEKYAYFLQTNNLLNSKDLMYPPSEYEMPKLKIAYNQSAYIVEYLIENYGLNRIKQQWKSGMECFQDIFGLTFDELILKINNELNQKYPALINLDWEKFNQRNY